MEQVVFNNIMKKGNHKISYCTHCMYPAIICGYCGMSTCSGGIGDDCKDSCEEAYSLFYAHKYPKYMLIRAKLHKFIYKKVRRIQVWWIDLLDKENYDK